MQTSHDGLLSCRNSLVKMQNTFAKYLTCIIHSLKHTLFGKYSLFLGSYTVCLGRVLHFQRLEMSPLVKVNPQMQHATRGFPDLNVYLPLH